MTFTELTNEYYKFLWHTFQMDVTTFSESNFILVILFSFVFLIKWSVLLIPFYTPPLAILRTILLIVAMVTGTKITDDENEEET